MYMSPEQGGGRVSEASDWYSLGVMLYQALTGETPFRGRPDQIMRDKQLREPRPPHDLVLGVPEDLDHLCCDLLKLDPAQRPVGTEVLRRLGTEIRRFESLPIDQRASPFVGRQAEFARLEEASRTAEKGQAVTVALSGDPGV